MKFRRILNGETVGTIDSSIDNIESVMLKKFFEDDNCASIVEKSYQNGTKSFSLRDKSGKIIEELRSIQENSNIEQPKLFNV